MGSYGRWAGYCTQGFRFKVTLKTVSLMDQSFEGRDTVPPLRDSLKPLGSQCLIQCDTQCMLKMNEWESQRWAQLAPVAELCFSPRMRSGG